MSSSSKNKKEKSNIVSKIFKESPKGIKYIFVILIIITLISTGTMFYTVFTSNTKTTKLGFEDVGELVTQTAYLTIVQDTKEHVEFFKLFELPFTESRQIFSYDIEVDASVDFSKISYKSNEMSEKIIIKLPHSKVYKTTLNTDSLEVFLDEGSLFSRIDLKKQNKALSAMKKQGEKDAIENGLLEIADKNAKRLIESFIKGNGKYNDYEIVYKYIS